MITFENIVDDKPGYNNHSTVVNEDEFQTRKRINNKIKKKERQEQIGRISVLGFSKNDFKTMPIYQLLLSLYT